MGLFWAETHGPEARAPFRRASSWDWVRWARGKSEGVKWEVVVARQWAMTERRAVRKASAKVVRVSGVWTGGALVKVVARVPRMTMALISVAWARVALGECHV